MTTLYAGSSMKVDSFWRCTGSAGVYPSVESGKDTNERQRRYKTADHCRWVNPVQTRWKRLFATSSSTAEQLMEIMLPPEYFSSMQSVSMLNSQESNAFIILSSNMALLTRKNFRLIPVRNQTGVSCAPENHQLTVDKWFSPLSLLSQHLRAFVRLRKVSETGSFSTIPSFTFSQPISPFIAFVLYIGLTLTILRIHFILVTGESRISRLSEIGRASCRERV